MRVTVRNKIVRIELINRGNVVVVNKTAEDCIVFLQ